MTSAKTLFQGRPFWMNGLMLFCFYMTFIYMPFDLFYKTVAGDQEVWFGFLLTGWAAKLTEPLHWLIYALGSFGFLKMKSWMWPWAAVYVLQVAISMFVWALVDPRGGGVLFGAVAALPFVLLAVFLLKNKQQFSH
ncbi:MAG: hypothetical protein HOL98_13300 [Gammaproteobacteria bacterium]|jgi:hypothetical protein|nr:hypothetical protein [Gammaproteobacteria bacterium]MBT5204426.1 hypothetical protein [Gammaproteobacteria bacterium]MBT5601008.1 hypothetical protein [Gammaproteobacteria bacterium]MBT6247296.1 hypothetical protein [Gammaproteobacteria bacterium]